MRDPALIYYGLSVVSVWLVIAALCAHWLDRAARGRQGTRI
jgi:hypothetical protein